MMCILATKIQQQNDCVLQLLPQVSRFVRTSFLLHCSSWPPSWAGYLPAHDAALVVLLAHVNADFVFSFVLGCSACGHVCSFAAATFWSYANLMHVVLLLFCMNALYLCFCEARFAGLSPWFAPVRHGVGVGGGGGGLHFGLVLRALFIFAPRSTPNKLLMTAVTLFSQGRVAAWPLAVAAEEHQHSIPHWLGSRAAFQASFSPISTQ
jgi:hypothetical protein